MKYELFNSLRTKNNLLSLGMKIKLLVKFRDQNSIYFTLNYNMITNTHICNKPFVRAFSGRIGLPPAVMGWAVSCDDGP